MMSPSISTNILLKINLRTKILYCLLFLKTEEEEFCKYSYQISAILIYILTNITEFYAWDGQVFIYCHSFFLKIKTATWFFLKLTSPFS